MEKICSTEEEVTKKYHSILNQLTFSLREYFIVGYLSAVNRVNSVDLLPQVRAAPRVLFDVLTTPEDPNGVSHRSSAITELFGGYERLCYSFVQLRKENPDYRQRNPSTDTYDRLRNGTSSDLGVLTGGRDLLQALVPSLEKEPREVKSRCLELIARINAFFKDMFGFSP